MSKITLFSSDKPYLCQKIKTMQSLKFKTNINCGGCVKAVTAFLDDVEGIQKWEVDTQNPDKILRVDGDTVQAAQIVEAVEDAGFEIVELVEE